MPELAPLLTAADLPSDMDDGYTVAEEVSAIIRDYCGWHIAPSWTETVTLDATDARVLTLPSLWVTAVSAVTVDGAAVASTEYKWRRNGQLWGVWYGDGWNAVTVTLTHGFPTIPAAVKRAGKQAAKREYVNPRGLRSVSGIAYSEVYTVPATGDAQGVALGRYEKEMLARYRLGPEP